MEKAKSLILIVDDHPDVLRIIKLVLEGEGYQVWTATNGQNAMERLEAGLARRNKQGYMGDSVKYLPDLILSDIIMPIMDGYAFYEQTRSHPALNHIPFIFLSAKTEDMDIRYGKELGADDYLSKPFEPADLLASVRGKLKRISQRRSLMLQFVGDTSKPPMLGVIFMISFILVVIFVAIIVIFMLT